MSVDGGFVLGCSCGNEIRAVNAGYTHSVEPCDSCTRFLAEHIADGGRVSDCLEWCGCGNPERIDQLMLAYLGSGDDRDPRILTIDGDASMLCAYIADGLGWTDHGGSVHAAWLTDAGREALTNLRPCTE